MKIFIFRIAKGERAGIVEASCPIDFQKKKINIENKINITKQGQIDYDSNGYIEFLHTELWKNGRARQGWGIEGLDLNLGIDNWIEKYLIGLKKYWNLSLAKIKSYDSCKEASGRFYMFNNTLGVMKEGDILTIPTHSKEHHFDSKCFTIATVAKEYYFDLNKKYQDFGHVIPIKNQKVISYDEDIKPMDFTGYYQRAVTEVLDRYKLFNKLNKMLQDKYL